MAGKLAETIVGRVEREDNRGTGDDARMRDGSGEKVKRLTAMRGLAMLASAGLLLLSAGSGAGEMALRARPGTPEAAVAAYFAPLEGAGRGLGVVPERLRAELEDLLKKRARGLSGCKDSGNLAGLEVSGEECERALSAKDGDELGAGGSAARVVAAGPMNIAKTGAWTLENPEMVMDAELRGSMERLFTLMGNERARVFLAGHEMGHSALRALNETGRLGKELPGAYRGLTSDEVFAEAFCDVMAQGAMAWGGYGTERENAALVARWRADEAKRRPEHPHLGELAEIMGGYAKHAEGAGASTGKSAQEQVSAGLAFLARTGVFDDYLGPKERWQKMEEEGCVGCFARKRPRPGR